MPKVLFVDDEPATLRAVSRSLKAHGFDVVGALGLCDARVALRQQRIDCCLLDIRLDGEWGLALVDELRDARVRVVLFSGCLSVSTTAYATLRLGVDDVVVKPASAETIVAAINAAPRPAPQPSAYIHTTLDHLEHELIAQRMIHFRGNITHAARSLGIHRQSLQRKLRKRRTAKQENECEPKLSPNSVRE